MASSKSELSLNGSKKDKIDEIKYKSGIQKLQKFMNPHQKVDPRTVKHIERVLNFMNKKLITHCHQHLKKQKDKKHIGVEEAETAVRAIFRGETVYHAVAEARRTLFKFQNNFIDCTQFKKEHTRIARRLKEARYGLEFGKSLPAMVRTTFPEARIHTDARKITGLALDQLVTRVVNKVREERTSEDVEITEVQVRSAVHALLPGALASHADAEAFKVMLLYDNNMIGATAPKRAKKKVSRRKSRQKSQSVGAVSRKKTPKRKSAAASSVSDKGSKSRTTPVKRKATPATRKSLKERPTSETSEGAKAIRKPRSKTKTREARTKTSDEESRSSSKSEKREVITAKTTQAKSRSRSRSKKRKERTETTAAVKPGKRSRTESDKRPVKRARKTAAVDETGEGPDKTAKASAKAETTERGKATRKKRTSEKVAGLSGAEFHKNLRDMGNVMNCDLQPDALKQLGDHLSLVAQAIVDRLPQSGAIDLARMDEAMLQVLPKQLSTHAAAYISRTLMASSQQE